MAIITEEALKERLENPDNACNVLGIRNSDLDVLDEAKPVAEIEPAEVNHKKLHNGGRRPGDGNIPPKIRALAGTLAHLDTAANVAENLNISPIQVHHLKHGRVAHDMPDPSLKQAIEKRLGYVQDLALDKLLSALDNVTEEKLAKVKVSTSSKIAKDMASIVKDVTGGRKEGAVVQFNIYAPNQKDISSFEVIDVERTG